MFSAILIRLTDYLFSIIGLIIFSPIIALVILIILIGRNHPIIYNSYRVGKGGKLFKIYKFQSMIDDSPTYFGSYIRRLSIDEIPQLINVIKGDMSIVGPRPLPVDIEKKIDEKNKNKRRLTRPGITGLTQMNYKGKYRTLSEKVIMDIIYIDNLNYILYLKIIFFTIPTLVRRFIYNKSSRTL